MGNLSEGQLAPDFTLPNEAEEDVSLSGLRGKWVVLYFYPKDNTSGCTMEAIDFTRLLPDFENNGAVVIGVSPDSCKSHRNFRSKHELRVMLLSDPEKKVLSDYGVWQKKSMYGREYMGVVRTTVLIDPEGKVAKIWPKVKVKGHAEAVLEFLKEEK